VLAGGRKIALRLISGLAGCPGIRLPGIWLPCVILTTGSRSRTRREATGRATGHGGGLERAVRLAERAADRAAQLVLEQKTSQPRVGELGLGQGQQGVLAESARFSDWGSGARQRVPLPAGAVGRQVLYRVQQVRDAAEESARFG
jgi:hypothetical protein